MNGSAPITINPVPAAYTLTVNGTSSSFCAGGTGVDLNLSSSELNTSYQLWIGGSPVGTTLGGTGALIDLGAQTTPGTYYAVATNDIYNCSVTMFGTPTITRNPLPHLYSVTGGGNYCSGDIKGITIGVDSTTPGISYQLYNGSPIGAPAIGIGTAISFPAITTLGTYTVLATNPATLCTSGMLGSATVGTYTLPTAYAVTVSNGGNYCAGGSGVHVGLAFSGLGINYQLYRNGVAVPGMLKGGSSSALDFGLQTATGVYTIVATNTATGCTNQMTGSATVTINPNPSVYSVTAASSSYCAGGSGIDIMLSGSAPGVDYQFYNGTMPLGASVAGTGLPLDFGLQTFTGSYHVTAVDAITGCSSAMFGSAVVTINPLPVVHNVTGGGNYCAGGAGVHVGLNISESSIKYQLYNGASPVGSPKAGTGSTLDFGLQTATGSYNVVAINPLTSCSDPMAGSVMVGTSPLPNPFAVSGGGDYCTGGAGKSIALGGSDIGISYQLYNGTSVDGIPVAGTNASLDFGIHKGAGIYKIVAVDNASGCAKTMTDSAVIVIDPLPSTYTLYGGGAYCSGGSGVHIFLGGSTLGDNYQLWNGTTPIGAMISATGGALDFGAQTITGTYTATATNALTGCSSKMPVSVNVTANPLPADHTITVSDGGHYCIGGAGVHVGLGWSDAGIKYQLFRSGIAVGPLALGGGLPLDFGLQSAVGTYTALAIDAVTGCSATMSGSATVAADPLVTPSVTVATGIGDTVCAGTVVNFTPVPVNGGAGPAYAWQVNGLTRAFGSSFAYTPSSGDVIGVTLTSNAHCAAFPTASGSMIVTVRPFQTPAVALAADPGANVCSGTPVTYTAAVSNGGGAPVLNWIKNSVIVASGKTSFTYTPADKDVVVFMLGSSYPCKTMDTVFSNPVKMQVDAATPPSVTIIAHPGTTLAPGMIDTFTAVVTGAGSDPKFQWILNGSVLPGETSAKFISNEFFNGDSLTCAVTSSSACGLSSYNSIVLSVKGLGVRHITTAGADISIMPNPNKGEFTVKGTLGMTKDEEVTLEITNMMGQAVYNNKIIAHAGSINEHIKLGGALANGMYILNLRSESATSVYHLVIEQ
jgi:hypothetical protein